jgi:hypothetical protein
MTANALKPKGVFGIFRMFRQRGKVWPDFKVTLIDKMIGYYNIIVVATALEQGSRVARSTIGVLPK